MEPVTDLFTRADYARLPEGFPAQLIDGCLVKDAAPSVPHQVLVSTLLEVLLPIVGPGRALPGPVEVTIDEFNVFQPDLAVYRRPLRADDRWTHIPLLVFEILSPSTARRDRRVKAHRYLEVGVEEVWLVDPANGTAERRSAAGDRTARGRGRVASAALPGFAIEPAALFASLR